MSVFSDGGISTPVWEISTRHASKAAKASPYLLDRGCQVDPWLIQPMSWELNCWQRSVCAPLIYSLFNLLLLLSVKIALLWYVSIVIPCAAAAVSSICIHHVVTSAGSELLGCVTCVDVTWLLPVVGLWTGKDSRLQYDGICRFTMVPCTWSYTQL